MKDPVYLADMKKAKMPVNPMTGEELDGLIKRVLAVPKPIYTAAGLAA